MLGLYLTVHYISMKDDGRDLVFSSTNILFFDVFELCVVYYQQGVYILYRSLVIPCTYKVFH
jgi:hypothetical protein